MYTECGDLFKKLIKTVKYFSWEPTFCPEFETGLPKHKSRATLLCQPDR